MSSSLTASMQARRHPETTHIDRLATADMLAMLHQDDKQISEAVGACLPDIARLIDIATATSLLAPALRAGRPLRRSATIRRKVNTRWWG